MMLVVRFAGVAVVSTIALFSPALANDAMLGTWRGAVGSAIVTIRVDKIETGVLIGTMTSSIFTYTLSSSPPSAVNARGVVKGNDVEIDTPAVTTRFDCKARRSAATSRARFKDRERLVAQRYNSGVSDRRYGGEENNTLEIEAQGPVHERVRPIAPTPPGVGRAKFSRFG